MIVDALNSVIESLYPEPYATLVNGMTLGVPISSSDPLYEKLKITGLVHIVVLSGSNINLLTAFVWSCTWYLGKWIALCICITGIIGFIVIVGPDRPIIRAGICTCVSLIGLLFGKKTITLYTLLLSFILILALQPDWISSISFQLSYASTTGIILFAKPENITSERKSFVCSIFDYLRSELRTTMAAQVGTVPIIWYYFKEVSLIAPVTNMLISWVVGPIMIFGMLSAIAGWMHVGLGGVITLLCIPFTHYLIWIIDVFSGFEGLFISLE